MGGTGEAIEARVAAELERQGGFDVTLARDPRVSIRPERPGGPLASGVHRRVEAAPEEAWRASVEVRATLGEGGMGMVHLGVQRSLGRPVAVKAIRPELRDEETVAKLICEARTTGYLEHPNIVPVHEIVPDRDGAPMIVLKRIEGAHWGALMRDPDLLEERFDVEDGLEWHLRVLLSVCNAVEFAHRRGVLHRDLKPENVMIGELGEVYVLDWGLAVRISDAGGAPRELPHAQEASRMAGTPSYMAPEMLGGAPPRLSPRTDVYLLGAILYELLSGAPPHQGDTLMKVLVSVSQSRFAIPDGAPRELAEIALRAMNRRPEDRYASAAALRDAIEGYLHHRGSLRLTEAAEATLEALRGASSTAEAQAHFAECRFGFELALEQWPENPRARRGARAARIAWAERLVEDDPRAAQRLVADLEAPAALRARITERLAVADAEREELARVRRELDPTFGRTARVIASVVLGVWWTIGPLVGGSLGVYGHDLASLAGPPAVVLPLFLLATWRFRQSALRTVIDRQLLGAAGLVMAAELALHLGGALGGLSPAQTHAIALIVFAVASGAMGLMVSPWLFASGLAYLAAFVVALAVPELRFVAQAIANLVMTVVALRVWLRARHPLAL